MNRAAMKTQAKRMLKPQFVTVLLAIIVSDLLVGLLSATPVFNLSRNLPQNGQALTFSISTNFSPTSALGTIVAILIGGPLAVGAMRIFTTVTAGGKAQLEQLFEPFKTNFVTCFLANLVSGIIITLFSLLLVIPGIMKAYSYAMVHYVLSKEPQCSAMDALHRSQELMRGHRMELFVLQLSFIGWFLLCVVTLGLAAIWVTPYQQMTETVFFDQLYGAASK